MFTSARLQLTLWYLLIIMTISLAFSVVIYEFLSREVDRFAAVQSERFQNRLRDCIPTPDQPCVLPFNVMVPIDNSELVSETKERIVNSLIFINGTILVVSGGLGYFLAGRTLRPIKDMVDDQNRFISDASHELKTPLTSLKTAFEVHLRNKKRSLKDSDVLVAESILEVDKLQQLSESLLQLASHQKPQAQISLKPTDLEKVLTDAMRRVTPLAKNKNISLTSEIAKVSVLGVSHSLTDLFVILLDNAIKYSENNTAISVIAKKIDRSYVQVSVTDQGKGIAKEDLDHIFERFYRSDAARTKSLVSGYGLGLSIAKQIASSHKTQLTAHTKLNHGTTFSIKLLLSP